MNFHFAGISCPGRRGGSESGFKGRCLVLQQSSAFEKLLGRSCSDPNINEKKSTKLYTYRNRNFYPSYAILQLKNKNGM